MIQFYLCCSAWLICRKAILSTLFCFGLFSLRASAGETITCNATLDSLIIYDLGAANTFTTLSDGQVIQLSDLPASWNVEALASGSEVGSIRFTWSGDYSNTHIQNSIPFRSPDDALELNLGAGTFTIAAEVFTQDNAAGSECDELILTFIIEDEILEPYEICEITGYDSPTGRVFYLPPYGMDLKATPGIGLWFAKYANGEAHMYGQVMRIGNTTKKFDVDLWFYNESDWAEWQAQGLQAHTPSLGDESTWTFYEFDPNKTSTLTGLEAWAGTILYIGDDVNTPFGLQLGDGANSLNANINGISTWFDYWGTATGDGDLNGTYTCTPECELAVDAGPDQEICGPVVLTLNSTVSGASDCEISGTTDCNHPMADDGGWLENPTASTICGDNAGTKLWTQSGDGTSYITLDLGVDLPAGTEICARMKLEHCSNSSTSYSDAKIRSSLSATSGFTTIVSSVQFSQSSYLEFCYTLTTSARYIKISDNGYCAFRVDYVEYTTEGSSAGSLSYSWSGPGIVGSDDEASVNITTPGTYIVMVTDCEGCTATDEVIVTSDDEAPVFDDQEISFEVDCNESIPYILPTAADNNVVVTYSYVDVQTCTGPNAYCGCTHIRVWTASDQCENSTDFTQYFHYSDTEAPVIYGIPDGATIECDEDIVNAIAFATDNCDDDVTISVSATTEENDCGWYFIRTWTATDDCGNSTSASQIITVIDTTPPLVSLPQYITVECDAVPAAPIAEVSDNCDDDVTVVCSEEIIPGEPVMVGGPPCGYTIIYTCVATDDCGNTSSAQQIVTVVDTTAPVLFGVPDDISIECADGIPVPANVFAIDNCSENPALFLEENIVWIDDCNYQLIRTWVTEDNCWNYNSQSQIITVTDNDAPVLIGVPENMVGLCDDDFSPAAVSATDNCDDNVDVTVSENISGSGCDYNITYTYTAMDDCGNSTSDSYTINVLDETAPVLWDVPANKIIQCDVEILPVFPYATDNCDGDVLISLVAETQLQGCGWLFIRTWTATDDCGNSSSATQVITVVDTTAPVATYIPNGAVVECDEEVPFDVPAFTDNCDDELEIYTASSSTYEGCNYTIHNSWIAVDDCGNETTVYQNIHVLDTTAPVLYGVPENTEAECGEIPSVADVTAEDNCDEVLEVSFTQSMTDGCPYTITRTWSVSDDCENTTTATQTVYVYDNTAPTLIGVPADIESQCITLPATAEVTATDNCDETLEVIYSETILSTICPMHIVRTWSVTDNCGNTTSASQNINFNDTIAPILIGVPSDVTVECGNIPAPEVVMANDNCDAEVLVSLIEEILPQDCGYHLIRTWSANDHCDNYATASQVIIVVDTTAPVISGEDSETTLECSVVPIISAPGATDICDDEVEIIAGFNVIAGECENEYTWIYTWVATDNCGNNSTRTYVFHFEDTTAPVLSGVPSNETVECDEIPEPAEVSATDNCDPNVLIDFSETITTGCPYTITRTWTAVDNCGNDVSVTQVLTVVDTSAPVLYGVPDNSNIECTEEITDAVVFALDNCDDDLTVSVMAETIEYECGYEFVRTWIVTDDCGNATSATQVITVTDTQTPFIISSPASEITVECDEEIPYEEPVFGDLCDEFLTLQVISGISNVSDCGYDIERTWFAIDDCGNSISVSQIVHILDTTAPVFDAFEPYVEMECDELVYFTLTATDNCDDEVEVNLISELNYSGNCYGTLERIYQATDDCGNTTTAIQLINVLDNTAPLIVSTPADATYECDEEIPFSEPVFSDNCDEELSIEFGSMTQPLSCGYIIYRIWTATDECENAVNTTQVIYVIDETAPVLYDVPANITLECDEEILPSFPYAIDNCDSNVTISLDATTELNDCGYTFTRTWTATDNCGNESMAVQIITIIDSTTPVITAPDDITVECDNIPEPSVLTATDNCDGEVTVTYDEAISGDCPYTITRTWTASDDCGNSSETMQIVTVIDNVNPVFNAYPDFIEVECDEVATYTITASDNCDANVEVTIIEELTFSGSCYGTLQRTYKATDNCGNFVTTVQLVQVVDYTAPELFNIPVEITLNCGDEIPAVPTDVFATDNCDDDVEVSFAQIQTNEFCPYDIVQTWTAEDDCGNITEGIRIIHVLVQIPPMVSLELYPNPVNESFTVKFSVPKDGDASVDIFDITGRSVMNIFGGVADGGRQYEWKLDSNGLNAGSYHVMVMVDSEVYNKSFIITGR